MLTMKLNLQNTFTLELPADELLVNTPRQVVNACFSYVNPTSTSKAALMAYSEEVAAMVGIQKEDIEQKHFLHVFSGNEIYENTKPYAMCYGGHQFGHWAGQLGDGRAINLFEVKHENKLWMLQLKGAGRTPYSRTADGLAVLRSSIREFLCSEAMHALGVPTTRALSLCLTGDLVLRDMLYNGNAAYEKGAVVCRVAPTFIRFGNFQIFAARRDEKNLKALTDYTIRHFYPALHHVEGIEKYISFFQQVCQETLTMIMHWQRVGFVHGVMNTDNMSILGLTIDYGPYGWLDDFNPDWTPNTTDVQHRRYRYRNQPMIAQWNLAQLANALYLICDDANGFNTCIKEFEDQYQIQYLSMMREKLGLKISLDNDAWLMEELEKVLTLIETDMTIFYRGLANHQKACSLDEDDEHTLLQAIRSAFYVEEELKGHVLDAWYAWMTSYTLRLRKEFMTDEERKANMNSINPKYVLRNYMAQMAIDKANEGDCSLLYELQTLLKHPYQEQSEFEHWFVKRPDWARNKTGCSALSCSS
jgi:uncharacterized protein YdiU (UPF0061 family)